jgi:hypothetical protein
MIDNFALALSHGLLLLAAWRLLSRNDLDVDGVQHEPKPGKRSFLKRAGLKSGTDTSA